MEQIENVEPWTKLAYSFGPFFFSVLFTAILIFRKNLEPWLRKFFAGLVALSVLAGSTIWIVDRENPGFAEFVIRSVPQDARFVMRDNRLWKKDRIPIAEGSSAYDHVFVAISPGDIADGEEFEFAVYPADHLELMSEKPLVFDSKQLSGGKKNRVYKIERTQLVGYSAVYVLKDANKDRQAGYEQSIFSAVAAAAEEAELKTTRGLKDNESPEVVPFVVYNFSQSFRDGEALDDGKAFDYLDMDPVTDALRTAARSEAAGTIDYDSRLEIQESIKTAVYKMVEDARIVGAQATLYYPLPDDPVAEDLRLPVDSTQLPGWWDFLEEHDHSTHDHSDDDKLLAKAKEELKQYQKSYKRLLVKNEAAFSARGLDQSIHISAYASSNQDRVVTEFLPRLIALQRQGLEISLSKRLSPRPDLEATAMFIGVKVPPDIEREILQAAADSGLQIEWVGTFGDPDIKPYSIEIGPILSADMFEGLRK